MSLMRLFPLDRRVAGRILLAIVVLASSLAWLPLAAQAAPQEETTATPRLEAWIIGTRVYVEATKLPSNHAFNLRARRHTYDSWTKLVNVRANRQGVLAKSVRLPSYLARADRLNVCLKDKANGRLYCTRARRQY